MTLPAWSQAKPAQPGVYRVRGWALGERDVASVVEVLPDPDGKLRVNIHENNSERDVEEWSFLDDLSDAFQWICLTPTSPDPGVAAVACDTCGGFGWIDETLGGYSFSNPKAPCPDCDGQGERTPLAPTPPSAPHTGEAVRVRNEIERMREQEWFDDWHGLPKTREESYVQGYLAALDELSSAMADWLNGGDKS